MDERLLQLKELKRQYKQMRRRAGWGWKIFAWLFFVIFAVLTVATLFVLFHHVGFVQLVDTKIWEPAKTVLGQGINYAACRQLLEGCGLCACGVSSVLWLLFWGLGHRASCAMKNTDTYRSWRTLKLTLETEKEEFR